MNSSTIRIMRGLQMVTQHTVTLLERDGMIRAQKLVNHAVDMSQTASKVIVCNNNHTVNVDDEMPNKMKEAGQVVNGSNSNANTDYCAEKTTTAVDNARSANANANPCDTAAETETKTKTKTTNPLDPLNDAGTTTIEKEKDAITKMSGDDSSTNSNTISTTTTAVPSSRISRAFQFSRLGMGLVYGTAAEALKRSTTGAFSNTNTSSYPAAASDANAELLASSLCRMRGAALKLGQMLSIQDETLLPPTIAKALQSVRQGADAMPLHQLYAQMESELGVDWRNKLLTFEETPMAAASIGQVHDALLADGRRVAIKVQYPGVGNSIESDLSNLQMLMQLSGLAPKGLFIENVIRVGREELLVECDYVREREHHLRFKHLIENDAILSREKFVVPGVVDDLCSSQVLTTEFAEGGTIDKVSSLSQEERNRIGKNILRLTMQELFVWRFMQTDPNWGNFLYDVVTGTTTLIDFGAAREFDKSFVDGYLRIVWANANRDEGLLLDQSRKMGFLTGEENQLMVDAHVKSGFTLGEPFASHEPYNFRESNISSRMSENGSVFMQHRLTPPPEEVYTLHRKLAGAYMLCIKLNAIISCRDLLEEVYDNYLFDTDGKI